MKFSRTHLTGFGYALAPVVVATEELEERLEPVYRTLRIPRGQLQQLTGIAERRFWEPGYPVAAGAALAARRALHSTGIDSRDIEALVYGAVCRPDLEPATACHVAAALHAAGHPLPPHAIIHDVSNACLGVVTGILDLANRIELGQIRTGMVVACESAREICEVTIERLLEHPTLPAFTRAVATFTGGSGAVAVIVGGAARGPSRKLRGAAALADPVHHDLCRWYVDPHTGMHASTDSAAVLEHGVALGERTFAVFEQELGWTAADLDRTVCHQIGAAHRQAMLPRLGLSLQHDFVAYEDLGNTGTVALPLATALAHERGFLEPGHRVGLLGIGSGLNCIMLGVEW